MNYLIISSVTLALMLLVYKLALSRTTLHGFNRGVLLATMVLSAILPLVHVDSFDFGKVIPTGNVNSRTYAETEFTAFDIAGSDMPAFESVNEESSINEDASFTKSTELNGMDSHKSVSWMIIFSYLWIGGAAFFILRLMYGIAKAEKSSHMKARKLSDGANLVITDNELQPTSWRNTIIINRHDYETDGQEIIAHEQAHVRYHHSIDIILARLCCAIQWFNPAAWMLERCLKQIHEYQADAAVLESGIDGTRYQICLVHAALQNRFGFVTSNLADCSTKKRIIMMNRNQTSPWASLRVLYMLPVMLLAIALASACNHKASAANVAVSTENEVPTEPVMDQEIQAILSKGNYSKSDEWYNDLFKGQFMLVQINMQNQIYVNTGRYKRVIDSLDEIGVALKATWGEFGLEYPNVKVSLDFDRNSSKEVILNTLNEIKKYAKQENIGIVEPKSYDSDMVRRPMFVLKRYPDYLPKKEEGSDKIFDFLPERRKNDNLPRYTKPFDISQLKAGDNRADIVFFVENNVLEEGVRVISLAYAQPADIRSAGDGKITISGSIREIIPDGTYAIRNIPTEREPYLVELTSAQGEKIRISCNMMFSKEDPNFMRIHIFDMETALAGGNKVIPPPPTPKAPMVTRQDSLTNLWYFRQLGKDSKWLNENRDKEEFFMMRLEDGKILVKHGSERTYKTIPFDDIVPYFRDNCPGGEHNAMVDFIVNPNDKTPVAFMEKVLDKMMAWVTTRHAQINVHGENK